MKAKVILLTSFVLLQVFAAGQSISNKCKLKQDKEASREYYTAADIAADSPNGFKPLEFILANFRLADKPYGKKDRINFDFVVENNGSLSFLRLIDLEDDADILSEVKRMVSLMPNYAAAWCGKTKVPYLMNISFPIDWLKKNK